MIINFANLFRAWLSLVRIDGDDFLLCITVLPLTNAGRSELGLGFDKLRLALGGDSWGLDRILRPPILLNKLLNRPAEGLPWLTGGEEISLLYWVINSSTFSLSMPWVNENEAAFLHGLFLRDIVESSSIIICVSSASVIEWRDDCTPLQGVNGSGIINDIPSGVLSSKRSALSHGWGITSTRPSCVTPSGSESAMCCAWVSAVGDNCSLIAKELRSLFLYELGSARWR